MSTILWRPEINALTTPQSYTPRHVPRAVIDNDELAIRMEQRNPLYTQTIAKSFLMDLADEMQDLLLNGNQITLAGLFTCRVSFTGRLSTPDSPLPPLDESLQVRLYPSRTFVEPIRQGASTERLPMVKKIPLITMARDTVLDLNDVLNPEGLLQLTGENLYFNPKQNQGNCVIMGTESGSITQTRFGPIQDSDIIVMPDVPEQSNPWNNEYQVSISTRYSQNGTLRTGTYSRMLRTPLAVPGMGEPTPPETGILSGTQATANVSINGGTISADTQLRIQAVQDIGEGKLFINLIDMEEEGAEGTPVEVTQDGEYILSGFAGSPVGSLDITVNNYTQLWELVRRDYGSRLVDVLNITLDLN